MNVTSIGLLPSVGASGQWYLPLTSTLPPSPDSPLSAAKLKLRPPRLESSMSNTPCRILHVEDPMSNAALIIVVVPVFLIEYQHIANAVLRFIVH